MSKYKKWCDTMYQARRMVDKTDVDALANHADARIAELESKLAAMESDAARWRFFMTEPDGFDVSVREYDDDGDEHWISCYPAAELQEAIDAARAGNGVGLEAVG